MHIAHVSHILLFLLQWSKFRYLSYKRSYFSLNAPQYHCIYVLLLKFIVYKEFFHIPYNSFFTIFTSLQIIRGFYCYSTFWKTFFYLSSGILCKKSWSESSRNANKQYLSDSFLMNCRFLFLLVIFTFKSGCRH